MSAVRSFGVLFTCALVGLGGADDGQTRPGKSFLRYGKPLRHAQLDMATGVITRGPSVRPRAAATVADFDNNDLGGFIGLDTGNGFCEWFDAGVKGFQGNQSDLMSSIVFAYCSSELDPSSGGPGGSTKLGFYEGYVLGGGAPTTAVAVFTLTGLPASTGSCTFGGPNFRCYFLEVRFASLVAFADGPIGYSWKFFGTITCGFAPLASTFPFMSCVASCSGTLGQVDGQGMADFIDEYCPPGTLRSTFSFGTASGTFTSISLEIREAADLAATSAASH